MTDLERMYQVDNIAQQLSTDRSTKIGAILVNLDGTPISSAANRMPRGVDSTKDERHARPEKYFFFEHAERNALYEAARSGHATLGGILYTTGIPCADCARGVIQCGLRRVVVWDKGSSLESRVEPGKMLWGPSIAAGEEMLREAEVEIVKVVKP